MVSGEINSVIVSSLYITAKAHEGFHIGTQRRILLNPCKSVGQGVDTDDRGSPSHPIAVVSNKISQLLRSIFDKKTIPSCLMRNTL